MGEPAPRDAPGTDAYRWDGGDLLLRVRAQPRASRTEWLGLADGQFRVRLAAPPVDGRANGHLREFLADLCGVAKNRVTLLTGETGRDKRLRIVAPQRLPPGIAPPASLPVVARSWSD
jgi:uncharacterized protein